MKYHLNINQKQALDLGIKNINQAHIFDLLTTCAGAHWCTPVVVDNIVYYWVARQTIVKELPILDIKPDTAWRHLVKLDKLGVIDYKKDGKKDLVRITKKGKRYVSNTMSEINPNKQKASYVGNKSELDKKDYIGNKSESGPDDYVGNKSELVQNSEMNPSKLGNKSESDSEINPTYPITNNNQITNIHIKEDDERLDAPKSEIPSIKDVDDFLILMGWQDHGKAKVFCTMMENRHWRMKKNWKWAAFAWIDWNLSTNHVTNEIIKYFAKPSGQRQWTDQLAYSVYSLTDGTVWHGMDESKIKYQVRKNYKIFKAAGSVLKMLPKYTTSDDPVKQLAQASKSRVGEEIAEMMAIKKKQQEQDQAIEDAIAKANGDHQAALNALNAKKAGARV